MSNTEGSASQEVCVLFAEAVAWIAYRNLNGAVEPAVGPRLLKELPRFGDDDDEIEFRADISIGREQLAQELLLDYAAKGKIRIYAKDGSTPDGADVASPLQLTTDFIIRAEFEFDVYKGATLFISEEQGYNDLAVNYSDLLREFWGDAAPSITIREPTARPERGTVPLRRRGRRPRYPWPDFAAELVRRSILGPAIANQAALEKHMLEWCHATWGAEPVVSEIREWVRPTFQMLARSSVAARAPNGMAGNSSPGIAEAAGK